ncbi:lichenan operon transcriptional antiterminator [Fontibacillus panacisegetis]|uniref:Lichenan operon transcriptional antiterminator n=1 Tax=Fontibacillus panacisegetis TaxID=670482 RepID=A0A1G7FUH8_9BACL|nr:BglG family transcription antiterminator [Fontibacillus panacisegetis]SDE79375.1 lichenan operon transcriptional antiterminator [Fontibacillus panacisegetis]
MYPRIATILRYLLQVDAPVKGEFLAREIEVTSRTVRSDIKLLNDLISGHGAEIHAVRGAGYELRIKDPSSFQIWLEEQFSNSMLGPFILPADRADFMIRKLLLAEDYVKIEDIANILYVSKSTVQNDLKAVKEKLGKYGIQVLKRPNHGMKISGTEFQVRFCMSEYFQNHNSGKGLTLWEKPSGIFTENELKLVRDIVIVSMRKHNLFFSDTGLDNLVIHILIAMKRIREGHQISSLPGESAPARNSNEAAAAREIAAAVEATGISAPEAEIAYLTMHLLGTELLPEMKEVLRQSNDWMDEEYYMYARAMVDEIEIKLKLGIHNDSELVWGLGLHLKPALNRIRFGMSLTNPMLESVKSAYPLAFQAGIIGAAVIQKQTRLPISENEIGYIALHIGAAMERLKGKPAPKKCIIICSSGLGSARLLNQMINKHFGPRLDVVGTFGYYNLDKAPLEQINFIISTVALTQDFPVPVIKVPTLLKEKDLQQIHNMMTDLDVIPFRFIREELTFLRQRFDTREEILEFLCKELRSKHLVTEAFLESVKQREAVSPTSFGNLTAIPHPIVPQTKETFWAICTLTKPVMWGDKQVQFVCLLCVSETEKENLTHMYDVLVHVTESPELVEQLIKAESYLDISNIFFLK